MLTEAILTTRILPTKTTEGLDMKTTNCVTYKYFIEDLVGEGSHTEQFLSFLEDAMGNSNSCVLYRAIEQELINGFNNNSLGELECIGWGAYGDIHFEFILNQEQEDNLKAFKRTLDICTEHFVTKYRLRWLYKFYTMNEESFNLKPRREIYRNDIVNAVLYLAKRKMRTIPAWREIMC